MKRINGYLCIDGCEKVLVDKDKNHYWVYIDGVEYYFKPSNFSYSELIAYYGAKIIGIDACFYDLAVLDGEMGYISKSLRSSDVKLISGEVILGEYVTSSMGMIKDMGLSDRDVEFVKKYFLCENTKYFCSDYVNNLEIIWQALEYRYGDKINIDEVMNQFVLMYMFSILFRDMDKHPGNWMIEESVSGIRLAPLFDNEFILSDYYSDVNFSTNFKDCNSEMFDSLRVFFDVSSSEYFELFVEKFEKLIFSFDDLIDMVERQIGIRIPFEERNYIIEVFWNNSNDVRTVIDGVKSRRQH